MSEGSEKQQNQKQKQQQGGKQQQHHNTQKKKKNKKGPQRVDLSTIDKPQYWDERVSAFDALHQKHTESLQARAAKKAIVITLPDGSTRDGIAWETTPLDVALGISKGLFKAVICAKVNGELYDAKRVLEADCTLELLKFNNEEASQVFWHSSAHILGQALERVFGGELCVGPPLANGGFFYDIYLPEGRTISAADYAAIQTSLDEIVRAKQPFVQAFVPKEEAVKMFGYNQFKQEILQNKVPDEQVEGGSTVSVYRCGDLIDLCRGPHIPSTGNVAAIKIWKNSSAYWKGDAENPVLQRVYGIAFPSNKQLKLWEKRQAALEAKSHINIGKAQKLFFAEPTVSPGATFWLPHGTRIYTKLQSFMRKQYHLRGFQEVVTPNMFNCDLWKTSGHWQKYKDDMFTLKVEEKDWGLKPMNCPGHAVMFGHEPRSWRELPLRFADFGVLHRNEASNALRGLTRVRRFQQDDAHIFCRPDQVQQEVLAALEFMKFVYGIFGFEFALEFSTRPENYMGDLEVWNKAEQDLEEALNASGLPWKPNPGDGAFYGPKIDIKVLDAIGREHQVATVQLDYQLPVNFKLKYVSGDKGETSQPVMIHRAIFGSLERFIGILIEHLEGKWPFWLSPRQAIVIPVGKGFQEYASRVRDQIHGQGFHVDVDMSGKTLDKKVRQAQQAQYNYILVVGNTEMENESVNVRIRDSKETLGEKSVKDAIAMFQQLEAEYK